MKAMIVFDINELTYKAVKEYFTSDITLHLGNNGFIDFKDAILQPMPQKKIFDEELFMTGNFKLVYARFTGWNDCIDEILGDEE